MCSENMQNIVNSYYRQKKVSEFQMLHTHLEEWGTYHPACKTSIGLCKY